MIEVKEPTATLPIFPPVKPDATAAYRDVLVRLGADGDDPRWSSKILDDLVFSAATTGSIPSLVHAMFDVLRENIGDLSAPLANLIKDLVIAIFTRDRKAYQSVDWHRIDRAISAGDSRPVLYFAMHAIPPETLSPRLAGIILAGLETTPFCDEAQQCLDE